MSAVSILGEELPRNVQDLLQAYFRTKNTTIVPEETYCIQQPRLHSTTNGKRVTYISQTAENVQVRGYTLPSMRHDKKSGEKLLVATGRAFPQPIVLARTKPHSKTFRQWLGAADDGTSAPVITRFVPNRGPKVENKRRRSSPGADTTKRRRFMKMEDEGLGLDAGNNFVAIQDDDDTITGAPGAHELSEPPIEPRSSRNHLANTLDDDDDKVVNADLKADGLSAETSTPVPTSRPVSIDIDIPHQRSGRKMGCTTTSISSPRINVVSSELLPQTTLTVEENTTFQFISSLTREKVRKRTLAKIDNVEVLFTHAYAADVIPIDSKGKKLPTLEAITGDSGEAIESWMMRTLVTWSTLLSGKVAGSKE